MCQSSVPNMILTVTLNAAIDKRYVVEGYQVGEVNRVKECAYTPGGKGLNVSKPASIAERKWSQQDLSEVMQEIISKTH